MLPAQFRYRQLLFDFPELSFNLRQVVRHLLGDVPEPTLQSSAPLNFNLRRVRLAPRARSFNLRLPHRRNRRLRLRTKRRISCPQRRELVFGPLPLKFGLRGVGCGGSGGLQCNAQRRGRLGQLLLRF